MKRKTNQRCTRVGGFTLVEVIIALSIFAVLSIIAYKGVSSLIQTKQRVEMEDVKWQQLIAFLDRFELDVKQSVDRPISSADNNIEPAWWGQPTYAGGFGAQLAFSRFGDSSLSGFLMDTRRVAYRLHHGAVELLIWPSLDVAPTAKPEIFAVLSGVRHFSISYLSSSGRWLNYWPEIVTESTDLDSNEQNINSKNKPLRKRSYIPSALQLTIQFETGEVISRIFAL